jgi:hypothetical protein
LGGVVVSAAFALVIPSMASATAAAAGSAVYLPWSVPGPAGLIAGGISCPDVGDCMTVGSDSAPDSYYADRLASSTWSSVPIPPAAEDMTRNSQFDALPAVSCSSPAFCAAAGVTDSVPAPTSDPYGLYQVDLAGTPTVETWDNGRWALQTLADPPFISGFSTGVLSGVSCPATGSCVAVGYMYGPEYDASFVETLANSTWSSTDVIPGGFGGAQSLTLTGVSCVAPGSCVASGASLRDSYYSHPEIASLDSGAWSETVLPLPPGFYSGVLDGISCIQPGLCVAVGTTADANLKSEALIETLSGGSWVATTLPSSEETEGLDAVSCAPGLVLSCSVVDGGDSDVWTLDVATWTETTVAVPAGHSVGRLSGVSCPLVDSCQVEGVTFNAEDRSDGLYTDRVGGLRANSTQLPYELSPKAGLNAVSCVQTSCMAVGGYSPTTGYDGSMAESMTGEQWSPSIIPISGGIGSIANSVSCVGPGWCEVVATNSDTASNHPLAATYSDGRWTIVALPTPAYVAGPGRGLSIDSISCPAIGQCEAVGWFEDASGLPKGIVEQLAGGTWSYWFPDPTGSALAFLTSVSCPAVGWCTAVGATSTDAQSQPAAETGWGQSWVATRPPISNSAFASDFSSVSCPGVDACVAVAGGGQPMGDLMISDYLSGGSWHEIAPLTFSLLSMDFGEAVGCVSTTSCVTGGEFENGVPLSVKVLNSSGWSGNTIGSPANDFTSNFAGVSCETNGFCLLVGSEYPSVGSQTPLGAAVELPAPTTATVVALSASDSSPLSGQTVEFTATVRPAPSAGDVTFIDQGSGQVLCGAQPVVAGTASCRSRAGVVGSHQILAAYSGDAASGPSQVTATQSVQPPLCPTGVGHIATGEPWAVAAVAVDRQGRSCAGYWVVTRTGGVTAIGAAPWLGDLSHESLSAPIVGISATPDMGGYYLVGADGGVFCFGDAKFYGSTGGRPLARSVVSMATAPGGKGYWLVAADGGVFSFGSAPFRGSLADVTLARPIVGMAADALTGGYWMVASDGGVFGFSAPFYGSAGADHLAAPIVGMTAQTNGAGYRLVGSDGGVFDFGDAAYYGSLPSRHISAPSVTTIAPSVDGRGYYLIGANGTIWAFGDAPFLGDA